MVYPPVFSRTWAAFLNLFSQMIYPPTTSILKYTRNILFVFGATFLFVTLSTLVLHRLGLAHFQMIEDAPESGKDLFYSCAFAPITEEIFFRLIPIMCAIVIAGKIRFKKVRWYYAFFISIVFALFHHNGYWGIYIQGVGGFFLCYLYFKNGKWGFPSAVIAHSLWNFVLCFLLPTLITVKPPPSIFYLIK